MQLDGIKDRQYSSFVDSPTRPNSSAREVVVENLSNNPVPVEFSFGEAVYAFGELSSLAALGTSTIATYTVPSGKIFKLKNANAWGSNISLFEIIGNSLDITKTKTTWTKFDIVLFYNEIEFTQGETIIIRVTNESSTNVADYYGTIQGNLKDA